MSIRCDLTTAELTAHQVGPLLAIFATGQLPDPCHRLRLKQAPMDVVPPIFNLMACVNTGQICPRVVVPYRNKPLLTWWPYSQRSVKVITSDGEQDVEINVLAPPLQPFDNDFPWPYRIFDNDFPWPFRLQDIDFPWPWKTGDLASAAEGVGSSGGGLTADTDDNDFPWPYKTLDLPPGFVPEVFGKISNRVAIGKSENNFDEAFARAAEELRSYPYDGPADGFREFQTIKTGAVEGGIAGISYLYAMVREVPSGQAGDEQDPGKTVTC